MDNIWKVVLIGGGAYLAYEFFFAAPAPAAATAASAAPASSGAAASAPTGLSLAVIQSSLINSANNDSTFTGSPGVTRTGNLNQWNYYIQALGLPTSIGGGNPGTVAFSGMNWGNTYTFEQVWNVLAPYLQSQGLSGLGYLPDLVGAYGAN